MKITFLNINEKIASARLRALIPSKYLYANGFSKGTEICVLSKHWFPWEITKGFKKVVYDVCDDHFSTDHSSYYIDACAKADLITCNSQAMKNIIKTATGRDAIVIDDPYEDTEKAASEPTDDLLWFGHASNILDITKLKLDNYKLTIVSNIDHPRIKQWSFDTLDQELNKCGIVLIPTGKSIAKSANRMVKSIRYGKFVCAEPLPCHSEIPGPWIGDIKTGIDWALSNKKDAQERTRVAQQWVRDRYSPETIGKQWIQALNSI